MTLSKLSRLKERSCSQEIWVVSDADVMTYSKRLKYILLVCSKSRETIYIFNETRIERWHEFNTIFDAILTCYQVWSNIPNTCKPSTPFPALWHTTQWSISSAERKSSRSEYNFRLRSSVAVAVQSHSNVVSVW